MKSTSPLREVLELLNGNVVDASPMHGSAESVLGEHRHHARGRCFSQRFCP